MSSPSILMLLNGRKRDTSALSPTDPGVSPSLQHYCMTHAERGAPSKSKGHHTEERWRVERTLGGRGGCMPRSLTLSSTSLVPEESFPPPMATKAPANTQSTAADHLQPPTNSQAPQPVRSDPSRAPKWFKLPVSKRNAVSLCLLQHSSMVRQLHAHEGATRASCLLSTNASQPQIKHNMHASTYMHTNI
ncbi:hypothetical protein PAMP_009151 [Pampus punctatissimus]